MFKPSEEAIDKFLNKIDSLCELLNTKSIKLALFTFTSFEILTLFN